MNEIYEFTLHPSGYDPNKPRFYCIGAGTLEDGVALIKDMNVQFGEWCDNQDMSGNVEDKLFKLRTSSDATPIHLWEGADIWANGSENYCYDPDPDIDKWAVIDE
jgi:hypothetical protein